MAGRARIQTDGINQRRECYKCYSVTRYIVYRLQSYNLTVTLFVTHII